MLGPSHPDTILLSYLSLRVRVRVLNIFRAEMFTPVFAISHGVRPISPSGARVARTARAALLSPRSGGKLGVLFRNRSIFVPRGLGDRSG